ncbi:sulfatase-like protein [Halogeometricum borinquense]|uniref:Sulfatase-like protein n=1 Tax=Halogeometricum borinquense TaxID=60847 RepID=A0A482T7I0_9EURY|nr:sulfatase [Halogeometricum borinquense]RYJ13700.1 sulfatase-like protein [Halogeometricum borinquense]
MNVLLITVDSLRADRVNEEVMPSTRSFADDALEFTECVANGPSTPASFPSIHASRHFASIQGLGIPAEGGVVTLAEHLHEAGYMTSGYTDNHFASGSYHYDRGFDLIHDASSTTEAGKLKQFVQSNLNKSGLLFKTIERVYTQADAFWTTTTGNESEYERAESLNRRALEWIDEQDDDEDWFVWLHYMDVHHPYEAPDEYQRKFLNEPANVAECRRLSRKGTHHPEDMTDEEWDTIRRLYDAECAYTDDQIDSLLTELDERGVRDDTVICLTADHGELVGEHQHAGHPPEFWEGIIRVPFILDGVGETGTVDDQIRLLDTAPTLADAVGLNAPSVWQGESALEVARGDANAREFAFGDVGRQINYERSYVRRADGWKLIRHADDGEFLYDVQSAPAETAADNRVGEGLTVYDELTEQLEEHQRQMAALRSGERGVDEDDEMVEEHLRDLGYIE